MNLRLIISAFSLLLSIQSFGQKIDTIFYDADWKETTKANHSYYRIVSKTEEGLFKATDYYKTGEIQMTGIYKSLSPENKEGEFIWYYQNGRKKTAIIYENGKSIKESNWDENGEEVEMVSLDIQPEYPGGREKLYQYIGNNFEYPRGLKPRPKGIILLSFVIAKDGTITDVKVGRSVHPLLDAEAVRVLQGMRKWKPGVQDGKPVRVKYNIPLNME